MKKRKKHTARGLPARGDSRSSRKREHITLKSISCLIFSLSSWLLLSLLCEPVGALLLKSNCLSSSPNCTCSWRSGKFVADCSAQNLTEVPKNDYYESLIESSASENQMSTLNRDIQMLNLSFNSINHLDGGEFSRKKFRNLQKLYLASNKLASIAPSAFFKLTGLIELDLSDNLLNRFDDAHHSFESTFIVKPTSPVLEDEKQVTNTTSESFLKDLGQLRQLNLNSNKLKRIEKFTFAPLVQLRQLYLSRNQIALIDKQAFDGLHVLNILHLDGNKLSYLNGEFILKLPQLHALQLAGQPQNRWRCDCHLRKLVRLLLYKDRVQGALNAQQQSLSILQDAPRCFTRARRRPLQVAARLDGDGLQGQKSDEKLRKAANEEDEQTQDDNADDHDDRAGRRLVAPGDKSIRLADSIVRPGDSHETLAGSLGTNSIGSGNISESRHWQQDQRVAAADDEQLQLHQEEAADDQFGPDGRLWTNMRLADFECPPEPANEYLWPRPVDDSEVPSMSAGESDKRNQSGDHEANNGIINRWPSAASESVTLQTGQHSTVAGNGGEPLELTCASEIADELDIELTRIEWFQWPVVSSSSSGDNKQEPRLLWTSNNNNNRNLEMSPGARGYRTRRREIMMKMMKYDSDHRGDQSDHDHHQRPQQAKIEQPAARQLAVIDYVTRANASGRAHIGKRLVRLVHLIHTNPGRRTLFLCRISNALGQLDLWYPVELNSSSALDDGGQRQQARRTLGKPKLPAALLAQLARESSLIRGQNHTAQSAAVGWPRDRAQTLIELELSRLDETTTMSSPLFVPLHVMPRSLLAPASRWRTPAAASSGPTELQKSPSSSGVESLPRSQISNSGKPAAAAADLSQMPGGGASLERSLTADERPVAAVVLRPTTSLRQTGGGGQHNESAANHQTPLAAEDAAATKVSEGQMRDHTAKSLGGSQTARTRTKISDGRADGETANDGDYDEDLAADQPASSAGQQPQPDKLHDSAMRLIGRFTSGERRSLVNDELDDEADQGGAAISRRRDSGGLPPGSRGAREQLDARGKSVREMLAEAWHREDTARARFVALYQVLANQIASVGSGPSRASVLMLLVGILGGCSLTSIFFLRLGCKSRRSTPPPAKRSQKVADSGGGCAITSSEQDEDDDDDDEDLDGPGSRVWAAPLAPPGDRNTNKCDQIALASSSPDDCPRPPASGSSGSTVTSSTTAGSQRMLVSSGGAHQHQQQSRFSSLPRRPQMMMPHSRTMVNFQQGEHDDVYRRGLSSAQLAIGGNYEHLMGGHGEGNATDDQFSPSCNSTTTTTMATNSDACDPTSVELHQQQQQQLDVAELSLASNLYRHQFDHRHHEPGSQVAGGCNKTCTLGRSGGTSLAARFIINPRRPPAGSGMNNGAAQSDSRAGQPARRTVTWLMSEAGDDRSRPCNELVNHLNAEQQDGLWRLQDGNNEQFLRDEHSCGPTTTLSQQQTIYAYTGMEGRNHCERIYGSLSRATANCARKLSQHAVPSPHLHHSNTHNACDADNGDGGAAAPPPPQWDLPAPLGLGEEENSSCSLLTRRQAATANNHALQQSGARETGEHEYYLDTRLAGGARTGLVTPSESNEICLLPADRFCLPGDHHLILDAQSIYTHNLPAPGRQYHVPLPGNNREGDAPTYGSHHPNRHRACSSSSPNVTSSASSSTSRQQQQPLVLAPTNLTSQLDDALILLQSSIGQYSDKQPATNQDRTDPSVSTSINL